MQSVKGDWVRIHKILLSPPERASQNPEDTKKVPLEMWDKGFLLLETAETGEEVEIETIIGRRMTGTLIEINPQYSHGWGHCIPEILQIGRQIRQILSAEEAPEESDNES
ncbi:2-amino-4-oxopentanoate thiolase subunit OrtA [Oceanispirochaeta sp.]|jgi:hypothetical protein|uniref:2-amino-4-oxopentanoate thiolase subunit OrtA n=1 Tax=Oceanispirochaeta sp. TaxID=2035350 RepID=UPI00260FB663|nr:2-amino-4-oxopentanoate thiolase subunit OrtA [Oceanispirochaeta sp.]MDA3957862.1 2-amino-4-oxopentanoate thiolase subunit OrtA [Oceanispirochaeta sp.]